MSNMSLWNSVCVTDPSAVKEITGKQYKGNSPKPYWIIQQATKAFGPCGIGWGVEVVNERFEKMTATDILHVALVRVWYIHNDRRGVVEQMGQTKAAYKTSAGKEMVDEDAPKKSVTDGMVKCLSMIGFAGDIFMGRWDDSGYVQWAREHFVMQDSIHEMECATSMESLRSIFTAAWRSASEGDKLKLKEVCDKRKSQLSQSGAAFEKMMEAICKAKSMDELNSLKSAANIDLVTIPEAMIIENKFTEMMNQLKEKTT